MWTRARAIARVSGNELLRNIFCISVLGMRLLEGLRSGRESLREVVAALEADVEAMYELIDRYDGERNATQGSSSTDSEQQSANSVSRYGL